MRSEFYDARSTFFRAMYSNAEGYVVLATMDKDLNNFSEEFFKWPSEKERFLDRIDEYGNKNVYYCPQVFSAPKRAKKTVAYTTCAWADLDTCHPDNLELKPSITIQTSNNKYQGIWLFDRYIEPDVAENISRRIAAAHKSHGADHCWNLGRLLRVPYTMNTKYPSAFMVTVIETTEGGRFRPAEFDVFPQVQGSEYMDIPFPSEWPTETAEELLEIHKYDISDRARELLQFTPKPGDSWSHPLWSLLMILFEAGFTREQTFIIANSAACNKFARDGKPPEYLWADVCRAFFRNKFHTGVMRSGSRTDEELPLLTDEEKSLAEAQNTYVERYITWASALGDAAPQYHQAGAFVSLSSLLAGSVKLPTSFGTIQPNLWFMILADTTLTRKAQPLDAKLLTPQGWKLMGDIQVGDEVVGRDGKPTKVLGISPRTEEEVYSVTFNDGSATECTADHLWTHKRPGKWPYSTWSLKELMSKPLQSGQGQWVRQIPSVAPVDHPERTLPIDPYLLGLLLGDGSLKGQVRYCSADSELVDAARASLSKMDLDLIHISRYDYRVAGGTSGPGNGSKLHKALHLLGLAGKGSEDKFVPPEYLLGSVEQRLALLQGLMDTDGWVGANRSTNFGSSSAQLALDVQYLVRSLGGWSNYNGEHATPGRDCHQVSVSMPMELNPFRLTRKASRLTGKRSWARPRSIRAITPAGTKTVQCIRVAAEDGLYVTDDFITTHNTTSMDICMDLASEVDPDVLLATDGSIEGLFTALSTRPKRPSVFLRDEFSGLLDQMNKRDYMAGFAEMLTKLYDGKVQKRSLRKEIIEVKDPCVILYTGGIRSKVQEILTDEQIASGFLPRFVFITAESDINRVQPLGPPTEKNMGERDTLLAELRDIASAYTGTEQVKIRGKLVNTGAKRVWSAELTREAWTRYNAIENSLMKMGVRSEKPEVFTPMYDRLAKSILKAAVLLSASRQCGCEKVIVEYKDIVHAASYGDAWRGYAKEIVINVGHSRDEKRIQTIYNAIVRSAGIARSALMQSYHLSSRDANVILETLEQRGLIIRTRIGRTETIKPYIEGEEENGQ